MLPLCCPPRPPGGLFSARTLGCWFPVSLQSLSTLTLTYRQEEARPLPFSVAGQRKTGTYSGSHRIVQEIEPESRAEDQSPGLVTLSYLGRVPAYTLESLRWFLLSIPANIHPLFLICHPPSLACLPQDKLCPAGSSSAWLSPYTLGHWSCNLSCISTVH